MTILMEVPVTLLQNKVSMNDFIIKAAGYALQVQLCCPALVCVHACERAICVCMCVHKCVCTFCVRFFFLGGGGAKEEWECSGIVDVCRALLLLCVLIYIYSCYLLNNIFICINI